MCRLIGWVTPQPTTLRRLLGDDAVQRLLHLSSVHCDGWGVAWRQGDELMVRRSQTQASQDPEFQEMLDSLSTSAAVVHLRYGTPGLTRLLTDTHPFSDGAWALAHNGAVGPIEKLDLLLPAGRGADPQGSTDSERWFLALRHEYERTAGGDPASRVAAAVAAVVDRATSAGLSCSSWNSMLIGPDGLYVVNLHDEAWQPGDLVLWPTDPDPARCWPPYFDLRMRERADGRVVISSGVVDDSDGWDTLPPGSVLALGLDAGEARLTMLPPTPSSAPAGRTTGCA